MARQPRRNAARQTHRRAFRRHVLFPVPAHRIIRNRTSRIKRDVVHPVRPCRAQPRRKRLMRTQHPIQLQGSRFPQQLRRKRSPILRKPCRRRHSGWRNTGRPTRTGRRATRHDCLITGRPANTRIADLVIPWSRVRPHLRRHYRRTVFKLHHPGQIENVLIVTRKQERLVALDRPSERRSKLVLHIARIESHKWRRRSSQRTVAQIIERVPVPMIRARLGHHIHHRAPGPSRLRPITTRLHAELLHHLVRKLVRRAISPRSLRIEPVVVVPSIHQEAVVISANPAIGKVPVRSRRQVSRILRHPRHQQQQIREPPPVQRQILDRSLLHQRR